MQILFFILAVGVTGVASLFNLGNGYIDSATWGSFALSIVTVLAWALWTFFTVAKSKKKKVSGALVTLLFLVASLGVIMYGVFGHNASVMGGIGLAGGLFFTLPFAGFTKLFGVVTPFLGVIPYAVMIALCWVLVWYFETYYYEDDDDNGYDEYDGSDEVEVEKETIYDYRPSDTINWEK